MSASFRPYSFADKDACLRLFDANCPAFFTPEERGDYDAFLNSPVDGYEVGSLDAKIVCAFGLINSDGQHSINWIMIDPDAHGNGIGSSIMQHILRQARAQNIRLINIAASHLSAPFFARFGAVGDERQEDGWGPGMHRVDMELRLQL